MALPLVFIVPLNAAASGDPCADAVKADLNMWKAQGNQPTTQDVMTTLARWDQVCHMSQAPAPITPCNPIVCNLLNSKVCGGSGATILGWRWHITSAQTGLDLTIPDVQTSGYWAEDVNDVGAGVQTGSSRGLLGGTVLGVAAASIQFGPLVLPADGGIAPNCTDLLVAKVSTLAHYSFQALLPAVLTSVFTISGDGTLCTVPC